MRKAILKGMAEAANNKLRKAEQEQMQLAGENLPLYMAFTVLLNRGRAHPWDPRWSKAQLDRIKCRDFVL